MGDSTAPKKVRTYRDLVAWQKAMELAEAVYAVTAGFPAEEKFGLVAQMRRATVSIPSNMAEGWGRFGRTEFRRFLEISRGSLFELQTQAELARRLGWLKGQSLAGLREHAREVDALLAGLIRSLGQRKA